MGRIAWRACDRVAKPRPRKRKQPALRQGVKATEEAIRWLETEGCEGHGREDGRPVRSQQAWGQGTGVRALIVALKPGNAGGAKGCRKVET